MTRAQAIRWRVGCVLGALVAVVVVEVFGEQMKAQAARSHRRTATP